MMLRIMWCRNALAWKSNRQYGPRRVMRTGSSVLTGLFAWHDKGWKPALLKALRPYAATP